MPALPVDFVESMSRLLPEAQLPAFLRCYEEPALRGVRLNPLKPCASAIPPDELLGSIPWEPTGYYLREDSIAGARALHECGAYYIQEPSAMLPAAVLDPQPGETVLDLCAAPGGKTTQLGLRMQGKGLLICNEPVSKRAQILSRNVERMGLTNAIVVSAMPEQLSAAWPEGFDAVMVDAPCSGEGMFRRHPETRDEWSLAMRDGCAQRQLDILNEAAKMVRPGGRLVYATCTLNPIENEQNVQAFCRLHPDFEPEPFSLPGVDAPNGYFTCYPHLIRGEGQFAARLRRKGHGESGLTHAARLPKPDKQQLKVLHDFCPGAPEAHALLGETLVHLPFCPELNRIKVLRAGLHLGSVRGKVFQPDHAWAVSVDTPPFPRIPLTPEQAAAYQHGDALTPNTQAAGFVLPTLDGLALGWGKCSDGMLKNHYPKGLRR